ncbi:MAG TPA: hypothetical protein PL110_06785 [Candidatus Eremiobacteraeota bacterium]|nr:MAG: hypothetical protein BWY64_03071 [bacterium ADurb.Bin363]HPZ07799.1 hypothetical protein [Candidatus Eremiobacteraeota bacterium]
MKYGKISILILAFFIFTFSLAYGKPGMIVKVLSQQELLVNMGSCDSLQTGDDLVVFRVGKPIAIGKIQKIDETSSVIRVIKNESSHLPDVGDTVRKELTSTGNSLELPYISSDQVTKENSQSNSPEPKVNVTPHENTAVQNYTRDYSDNPLNDYYGVLDMKTRVVTIDQGKKSEESSSTRGDLGWTGDLLLLGLAVSFGDPIYVLSTAGTMSGESPMYDNSYNYNVPTQPALSAIKAVLWDEELCAAYSNYNAFQRGANNQQEKNNLFHEEMKKRSVNTNLVFQLTIDNTNTYPVKLAPFKYKVYLEADGNRCDMEKNDTVFDGDIRPGGKVDGFIYFPKVSAKKLELHIEELWDRDYTLKWEF